MARESKTKYIILGLLTVRPKSGYDIKQDIRRATSNFWRESCGQIYPTLAKLLKNDCVSCNTKQCGARTRKVYKITKKGKKLLHEWLLLPPEPAVPRNELLLKLFFSYNAPAKICMEHIKVWRLQVEDTLQYLQEVEEHLQDEHSDWFEQPYWIMAVKYGRMHAQTELEWCDDALKVLGKIKRRKNNESISN